MERPAAAASESSPKDRLAPAPASTSAAARCLPYIKPKSPGDANKRRTNMMNTKTGPALMLFATALLALSSGCNKEAATQPAAPELHKCAIGVLLDQTRSGPEFGAYRGPGSRISSPSLKSLRATAAICASGRSMSKRQPR